MSNGQAASASDLALARALDDLRRGEIIRVTDGSVALDLLAAELATIDSLARLEASGRADLGLIHLKAPHFTMESSRDASCAAGLDRTEPAMIASVRITGAALKK